MANSIYIYLGCKGENKNCQKCLFTLSLLSLSKSVCLISSSLSFPHTHTHTHICSPTHCQEYCICLSVRWKVWIPLELLQDTTVKHTLSIISMLLMCVWVCVRATCHSDAERVSVSMCVFLSHRISHYRAIKATAAQTHTHKQTGYTWLTAHSEMPGRKQQKKSNTHREEIVILLIATQV